MIMAAFAFQGITARGAETSASIEVRTVAQGAFSGIQQPTLLVITNKAGLQEVWSRHTARKEPLLPPPQIDFSKEMVLFAGSGRKNTGGHRIQVDSVKKEDAKMVVDVRTEGPKPGGFSIQAITSPFHIVAIPATTNEIEFRLNGKVARSGAASSAGSQQGKE